jgi:protein SCO1/2
MAIRARRLLAAIATLLVAHAVSPLARAALPPQAGGVGGATPVPPPPPPAIVKQVGFDQELGVELPLDLAFRDDEGRAVRLRELVGERPLVLVLVYYRCPMLCKLVLDGLARCLQRVELAPGRDFELVVVSIDPRETPALAAERKASCAAAAGNPGAAAGMHFLVGEEPAIRELAGRVGFRYAFDEPSGQYAHASGIVVLTPAGVTSRYFLGIDYPPRDVRLALVEASAGKIGSLADQVALLCFQYDPASGRYGLAIVRLLRILGVGIVVAIVALIVRQVRRERRRVALLGAREP